MVAKNDLVTAAERIDVALQEFTHRRPEAKTLVFADELGHLQAVVATHGFEDMPNEERVRLVWEHLRDTVPTEELGYLYKIHAFTGDEYDARVSSSIVSGDISESLDLN